MIVIIINYKISLAYQPLSLTNKELSMKSKHKKTPDYWGIVFVGSVFLSSLGSFMAANHGNNTLSYSPSTASQVEIARFNDVDQNP